MRDRDDRIAEILAEWYEREGPRDPEELLRAHPDYADELRGALGIMPRVDEAFRDEDAPRPPEEIADFRIVRELGRGGMGVVYEAEQASLGRKVALKVLSLTVASAPHAVKRFEREARAAARLHHTNIVPIHAMGQYAGCWYYAMELVQGRPLSRVVKELQDAGRTPREESLARMTPAQETSGRGTGARSYFVRIAEMFAGVAEALELAHHEGIVHRDIKPSNLMLDADGTLKIVDFGLALESAGDGPAMTITGDLLGTPAYMSPEQAMAKRVRIDHRTDIYSLGATLYELATLRPPFRGDSLHDICSQIIAKDPAAPRRVNDRIPRDLETIILKAMAKDRDRRYATAAEMARDLRRFADGAPVHARRVGLAGRAWMRAKRHKVRTALAVACLLLGSAAALLAHRAGRERERVRLAEYEDLLLAGQRALSLPGDGLNDHGLHEDAGAPLGDAIALLPDRAEAYWLRALAAGRTLQESLADLDAGRARGLAERTFRLTRAHVLTIAGRWEEAQEEERGAAAAAPGGATDDYFEAELLLARGERERAAERIDRAAVRNPHGSVLRRLALRRRAMLFAQEDLLEKALADLHALREMGDESPTVLAREAWAWRRLGREETAAQLFDRLLEDQRARGSVATWTELGQECRRLGVREWNERATAAADEAAPGRARIMWMRARALADSRPGEAVDYCERALAEHGENALLCEALAGALYRTDRAADALRAAERGLDLDPASHRLWEIKGNVLGKLGRHEEALAAYDQALDIFPLCAVAHGNRAEGLRELGRHAESLEAARRAIAIDPAMGGAHFDAGQALLALGDLDGALAAFDRAIACFSNADADPSRLSNACVSRSAILLRLGRPEEALAAADAAIRADEALWLGYNNRGVALETLGRMPEALLAYDAALACERAAASVHGNRGFVLLQLGRPTEALAAYRRLAELEPASSEGWKGQGEVALVLGRADEALRALEKVLEIEQRRDPAALAPVHYNRGVALWQLGREHEAAVALERALELGMENPGLANQLAWALAAPEGATPAEAERAVKMATIATKLDPREGTYWNTLGVAQYRAGQPEACARSLRRAMELREGGDAYDWFVLAMASQRLGQEREAREWHEKAAAWTTANRPDDEELKRFRAEAEQALGRGAK